MKKEAEGKKVGDSIPVGNGYSLKIEVLYKGVTPVAKDEVEAPPVA